MRTIKMLGLATTAALMAMALLGASSASADFDTALCEVNPAPGLACPPNNLIEHIHEATLPGLANRGTLLATPSNIRCHVLFLGDTEVNLAKPLIILGTFTYTECNLGCEAIQVGGAATVEVLKTGVNTAVITGEGEVLVNCPSIPLHCIYNGKALVGHGLGSGTATELNGESRTTDKTVNPASVLENCPASAKLDVVLTPLIKTWITS